MRRGSQFAVFPDASSISTHRSISCITNIVATKIFLLSNCYDTATVGPLLLQGVASFEIWLRIYFRDCNDGRRRQLSGRPPRNRGARHHTLGQAEPWESGREQAHSSVSRGYQPSSHNQYRYVLYHEICCWKKQLSSLSASRNEDPWIPLTTASSSCCLAISFRNHRSRSSRKIDHG